ncbi:NYN domain-containing protein [Nocardioides sp.]|uniref:NYN domain-containing protein n=1 Tax=Nocardioides sp. TaxID=35761 RepID=UPI0035B0F3A2
METSGGADRIAVMIDADNTRAAYANEVLSEVAKYGNPTIRRVYGDWTNPHLSRWARILNSLGLRAMHQNAYTSGKNSTDLALVIDAMDLLYDGNVEAFALVTSDSDFTSLAHRLRESGKAVYVLGENKAPESLRNACDKFIDLAVVAETHDDADDDADDADADEAPSVTINLQSALTRAVNAVSDDEGWASLPALGNQLIRTHPSFDARNFAGPGARLSTLVTAQPYLETSGSGNALRVRLKGSAPRQQKDKQPAEKAAAKKSPAKKAAAKKGSSKEASASAPGTKPVVKRTVSRTTARTTTQG